MRSSPNLLLLWDIDGTLLASGGAGMRALRTALAARFGIDGSLEDIDFGGRTDPWIMRRIFEKFRLPDTAETMAAYTAAYFEALPAELLRSASRVLPGVPERLAEAAARPHVAQGLLTGNRRRGAEIKLAHHGLWETFAFGAFADDHELRNELGPFALHRAREHHGVVFAPERTWIIGTRPTTSPAAAPSARAPSPSPPVTQPPKLSGAIGRMRSCPISATPHSSGTRSKARTSGEPPRSRSHGRPANARAPRPHPPRAR